MATIIEKITFKNLPDSSDSITSFKWSSRMMCYIEGSAKGFIKIRNIEKQGECMMMLSGMQFTDRVQAIAYSETRNILFIASRDGKFYAWKLPTRWRREGLDKFERDLLMKCREEDRAEELQ
jgi:WD40 repeat protein